MLPDRTWNLAAVCRLLVLLFIGISSGSLIMQAAGEKLATELNWNREFLTHVIAFMSLHGLGLLWVALFLREHHVGWRDGFGLRNAPRRSLLTAGIATIIAVPVAMVGIGTVVLLLLKALGLEPPQQSTVLLIKMRPPPLQLAVLGFAAVFLAPIVEETIFRGILYPALKQRGYPNLALWGTALLFGVIHFNLAALLPLTFLALVFTWLYERTGNLLSSIVSHAIFNAVNFVALVSPPKWLERLLAP